MTGMGAWWVGRDVGYTGAQCVVGPASERPGGATTKTEKERKRL